MINIKTQSVLFRSLNIGHYLWFGICGLEF